MRAFFASACAAVALLAVITCARSASDALLGTWQGKNHFGQSLYLTFGDEGRLAIEVVNADGSLAGNGYATYAVDFSHVPAHFDYQRDDGGRVESIIELVDENTIAYEDLTSGVPRPIAFGAGRLVLTRRP